MNGTSLTDIANSIIAELKEEGIEPTLENITDRLNKHINLKEWAGCSIDKINFCNELLDWSRDNSDYHQCFYIGDNIWAVKSASGVTLLKAESYGDAYSTYLNDITKIAEFLVEGGDRE